MAHPHVRITTKGSSDNTSVVGLTPTSEQSSKEGRIKERKRRAKRPEIEEE